LKQKKAPVIAAVRKADEVLKVFGEPTDYILFDMTQPETFAPALAGVKKVYLMRPPAISDSSVFREFVQAAKKAGVQYIVYLSVMGAEKNPVIPHHTIENTILDSGIAYTFLRPSYFMQNLSTTHRDDIRLHHEVFVPAGKGKTSFIDVRDIAAVAAMALTQEGHLNKAYELSGNEALDYYQVAAILTEVLGRKITYTRPSVVQFFREMQKRNLPVAFIMVMVALYTVARVGLAKKVTSEFRQLMKRDPISFRQFAEDYKQSWM
jgi:uncharacterized protein YbjT (DUF2867 family)